MSRQRVFGFFVYVLFHVHITVGQISIDEDIFVVGSVDNVNVTNVLENLVSKFTSRLNCDSYGVKHEECESCLKADRIMELLHIREDQRSLSRTQVNAIATLLLHHVLYFPTLCKGQPQGCADYGACRDEVYQLMLQARGPMYSMEYVLHELKYVLKPVTSTECFSAKSILLASRILQLGCHDKFLYIIMELVSHIFSGHCIQVEESVNIFIDDIFHSYGTRCFSFIDKEGLERIKEDLQRGGLSHVHEHGGHNHHHDHNHQDHDDCMQPDSDQHKPIEECEYMLMSHSPADFVRDEVYNSEMSDMKNSSMEVRNKSESYKKDGDLVHFVKHDGEGLSDDDISEIPRNDMKNASLHSEWSTETTMINGLNESLALKNNHKPLMDDLELELLNKANASEKLKNKSTSDVLLTDESVASAIRSEFFHLEDSTQRDNSIHFGLNKDQKLLSLNRNERKDENLPEEDESHVHNHHISPIEKCLSIEELLEKFGHSSNTSLTKLEFLEICPAIVQQVVSGVCSHQFVAKKTKQPTKWELYGYSTLAVFFISLTSLAGVVLLPILAKKIYYYVMAGCIGLAFSTLAGDALLHLIPQALGVHSHGEEDHSHEHEGLNDPTLMRQMTVFLAIYLLYLFEATMCAFSKKKHAHSHGVSGHGHTHIPETLSKELALVSIKVKSDSNATLAMSADHSSSSLDTEIAEINVSHMNDHKLLSAPTIMGMSTVALLIILGDSIHNFSDGLAIGAAFTSGIRSGLSTSIAVFCHELPHEFGDFVVLLSTGLSFSKALWLNFLSGLTCLVGLYIGIQVGVDEDVRTWIMAVTAGIFLYVALTEMLPELKEQSVGSPVKMLIVKNVGVLAGLAIMVLISIYEHEFYF